MSRIVKIIGVRTAVLSVTQMLKALEISQGCFIEQG
jgi:hypothetical protein